jgi:uncharacterized protein (DUF4415 family)
MKKEKNIMKYSAKELQAMQKINDKSDWAALKSINDRELENNIKSDSDSDTNISEGWMGLVVGMPEAKEQISIRIDRDVLRWFRSKGSGYQTYINNILRSYVAVQSRKTKRAHHG